MPLRKLTANQTILDPKADRKRNVTRPLLIIQSNGRGNLSRLTTGLVGITSIRTPDTIKAIEATAAALTTAAEEEWSVETARKILEVAGALPAPTHVLVSKLEDEGSLVFRSVPADTPKLRKLIYVRGSQRPQVALLGPLRELNITVPKGMKLVVPATLVQDNTGFAVVASLKRGQLKSVSDIEDKEE